MKLKQFYNKKVNIVTKEEIAFSGVVTEYFYTDENESGKVEFYEEDIKIIYN